MGLGSIAAEGSIASAELSSARSTRFQGFVQALRDRHVAVSVRWSRGLEADAACGQLRASKAQTSLKSNQS